MVVLLEQYFYHFHYDFFCEKNSDGIKFDDHYRLKLKNSFISSEHGQTKAYYISKFIETSTQIQWGVLFLPIRSFLQATH